MKLEPVIGLEIHVQLGTKTKMFCRCSTDVFGKPPNSYVCPVCLGLPGALPVTNAAAIRLALTAGEMLGAKHPKVSKFDRKNYFYPDLPKGYQISQYDQPLNIGGVVEVDGQKIKLTRAHLEEDTGKLLHQGDQTLIDFNRSGIPLLEVVTEPEITSPAQARILGQKVQLLMRYAGVSEADMEKGSLRVDANVSLRPLGSKKLGTKVEVKNMNSFRSVERALQFEIERQGKILSKRSRVVQETRGWVEEGGVTVTQRVKEQADDYRYFPEPDLPAIEITTQAIKEIKQSLPDSPDAAKKSLVRQYKISEQDAAVLAGDIGLLQFYRHAVRDVEQIFDREKNQPPDNLSNKLVHWLLNEYIYHFKNQNLSWENAPVTPAYLAELVYLFDQGKVSSLSAKSVLEEMFAKGETPSQIINRRGYLLQSDASKLQILANEVLAANPQAVADYRAGKSQAFSYLLGQLIKNTSGQAEPAAARQAIERALKSAS